MRLLNSSALVVAIASFIVVANGAGRDIFEGSSPIDLRLEAPLRDLFAHAAEEDEDYSVEGRLALADPESGGTVSVDDVGVALRGHTSRRTSECDFPKLKLTFEDDSTPAPLAGLTALKLGTHCGDRSDADLTPKYGRLANERAPHREALVYAMLEAAGIPTLRARPARLTYVHTDAPGMPPLVRQAMLLEDDADAGRRFEATDEITEEAFSSARDRFAPADTARLALAQALIGNFDWCLRFFPGDIYRCNDRHPLWNVHAFVRRDGTVLPVIYDFDLAGPVVGRHIWFRQVFDTAFVESGSATEVEVLAQLQRTRSLFDRRTLDAARRAFVDARGAVYRAIDEGVVDEQGREQARRYADTFYTVVEDDARFYMPVVTTGGVTPMLDPGAATAACPGGPPAPAGTPVSEPLERKDDMVRVRLLDALWQWTGRNRCDAVHRQPVWLPADAIGTDYPR